MGILDWLRQEKSKKREETVNRKVDEVLSEYRRLQKKKPRNNGEIASAVVACAKCGRSWRVPDVPYPGGKIFISTKGVGPNFPVGECPKCGNVYCRECAGRPSALFYYCPECDKTLELTPETSRIIAAVSH